MPPLASSPSRGYPDGQRVENWDSPILYTMGSTLSGVTESSGVQDVSRYAYLGGSDQVSTGSAQATVQWFTNPAPSNLIGTRLYALDHNIVGVAQYRIPNLGPYVRVLWDRLGAVNAAHGVSLLGTNRAHPLEFIPVNPVLISRSNVAIAGSTTLSEYPQDYYAGPIRVTIYCTQTMQLTLDYLAIGNVWANTWVQNVPTTNTWTLYDLVTPPGAWRLSVNNFSVSAGNYYLFANHSMTGGT